MYFKEDLKIRRGLSFNRIGISRYLLMFFTLCICQLCLKTSDSEFGIEHTELLSHCSGGLCQIKAAAPHVLGRWTGKDCSEFTAGAKRHTWYPSASLLVL